MNHEYKSNRYKKDQYLKSIIETDGLIDKDARRTRRILEEDCTEYTEETNLVIQMVQKQFLEGKREEEINKALDNKDEERFLALTSKGWEKKL
ncbi:IDEAL domain-containing protein [Bacillus massiliglaciei]|uniref:IDEAL domain-containing protein n=1 Tax=Bacillus massiliglaciei TaxID=1816693 RepID=UPI000DA6013D|nr:IDEAL domain-containing protein [Bacillus massiliglaciei]